MSPSATDNALKEARHKLKQVHTERSNTSAKEEFARWAKLDRESTKLANEIEVLSEYCLSFLKAQQAFQLLRSINTFFFSQINNHRIQSHPFTLSPKSFCLRLQQAQSSCFASSTAKRPCSGFHPTFSPTT